MYNGRGVFSPLFMIFAQPGGLARAFCDYAKYPKGRDGF